jgi:Ca-activated chloride channel family protein
MSVGHSKLAVATLGVVLAGTTLGWVPVGRFQGPRPWRCVLPPPPTPIAGPNLHETIRVGPVTVDAALSHGKIVPASDGSFYVDVRVTADALAANERRPIDLALVLDTSGSMQEQDRIGLLRKACDRLAADLGPDDRVALVTFSTDSRTLFPLGKFDRSTIPAYTDAVKGLIACGGTNIASGLERGAAELEKHARPGAARRLLLLTDGQPTVGVQAPEALKSLARRLSAAGFSVGTVGLGLEFNASLLSAMAEVGGGLYHYVDSPDRLAGIYDAELRSLRALVAKDVTVMLVPEEGFEIVRVVEWQATRLPRRESSRRIDGDAPPAPRHRADSFDVRVGDLEAGRAVKIVAELRWAGAAMDARVPSGAVHVVASATHAGTGQVANAVLRALSVGRTSSVGEFLASANPSVRVDLDDALVAESLEQARACTEKGDVAGARANLKKVAAVRNEVQYKAADGRIERMDVQTLERALCDEPASGETNQRAQRWTRSAASSAGR